MKRTTLIYALVMLVALTAIMVMAQEQPANQPAGCFANCQKMLGLSQDQIAEMTRIRTSFVDDTAVLRTDLQAKMKEISSLWAVAAPDLQLIKHKAAEADQIRAEIRDKSIDTRGALLMMLTSEQRDTCIVQCQSGQCGCGMCDGIGMGMGMCGAGYGNAAGVCPMAIGAVKGRGSAGMSAGRIGCGGGCCPARK